jgi:hypothetical protein
VMSWSADAKRPTGQCLVPGVPHHRREAPGIDPQGVGTAGLDPENQRIPAVRGQTRGREAILAVIRIAAQPHCMKPGRRCAIKKQAGQEQQRGESETSHNLTPSPWICRRWREPDRFRSARARAHPPRQKGGTCGTQRNQGVPGSRSTDVDRGGPRPQTSGLSQLRFGRYRQGASAELPERRPRCRSNYPALPGLWPVGGVSRGKWGNLPRGPTGEAIPSLIPRPSKIASR